MIVALRERVRTLKEMAERAKVWYCGIESWDEAAVKKHLLPARAVLEAARRALGDAPAWSAESIDAVLREIAAGLELGLGKVAQPLRVAMTGSAVSPSIEHTILLCGREAALQRLDVALALIAAGGIPAGTSDGA